MVTSVKSYTTRAAQLTRLIRRARVERDIMGRRFDLFPDVGYGRRFYHLSRRHDALLAAGWDMVDGDRWML
jgi:hypothetical protein